MDQKALFRKAALDKLASPERLDVMIKVTSPFGWLAMATVGLVLVGVIIWSIAGNIPTRVSGTGILAAGTTLSVPAPAAGPLTTLAVSEGDEVEKDQVIAQIELKGDQRDYENAKDRFERRQTNYQNVRADVGRSHRDIDRQIRDVQSLIDGVESEITRLQARLGDPKYSTNKTNREIAQHRQTIASYTGQITSMRSQKDGGNQRVAQARNSMEEARAEVESYEAMLTDGKVPIKSPVSGRIVEVVAIEGATLRAGDPIVRVMEGYESGLKARFYVGAANAVTIGEDMVVEISPAGIKKEEYGFLKAKVVSRSDQALTLAALQKEIPPEGIRQEIMDSQGQAVYRIDAEIEECGDTPTGFCWSSGAGPIGGLSDNMRLEVNVITATRKPYTLVIPKVKKAAGLS